MENTTRPRSIEEQVEEMLLNGEFEAARCPALNEIAEKFLDEVCDGDTIGRFYPVRGTNLNFRASPMMVTDSSGPRVDLVTQVFRRFNNEPMTLPSLCEISKLLGGDNP